MGINVLSLFDGISGAQVALNRANIEYDTYIASEIDKNAMEVTNKNYPNTIQLGDVYHINKYDLPEIDLLIAGSPCQGFSWAGKRLNFDDPRSKLFFEFDKLLNKLQPKYFMLENVVMAEESIQVINTCLGVDPIKINSSLVSAQNRRRLYWTNIPNVSQPDDRGIKLEDVVEPDALIDREKAHAIIGSIGRTTHREYFKKHQEQMVYIATMLSNIYGGFKEKRPRVHLGKSATIRTASGGGHIPSLIIEGVEKEFLLEDFKSFIRKVTPLECERLQTLPDNYTEGCSNTQRYKMIGNGFTVDVVAHILKGMKG